MRLPVLQQVKIQLYNPFREFVNLPPSAGILVYVLTCDFTDRVARVDRVCFAYQFDVWWTISHCR